MDGYFEFSGYTLLSQRDIQSKRYMLVSVWGTTIKFNIPIILKKVSFNKKLKK
jgi:hypothetical protein